MNRGLRNLGLSIARRWWKIWTPTSVGVRVIIADRLGAVALVRHTYGDPYLYLPGGGVKRGEAARDAAARELGEELGISVDPESLELRSVHHSRNEHRSDHIIVYFASIDQLPAAGTSPEIAEVVHAHPHELPDDCSPATKRRIHEFQNNQRSTAPW